MRENGWSIHEVLDWQHIATWGGAEVPMEKIIEQLMHGRWCAVIANAVPLAEGDATHLVQVEQARKNQESDHSWHVIRVDYFLCKMKRLVHPKPEGDQG